MTLERYEGPLSKRSRSKPRTTRAEIQEMNRNTSKVYLMKLVKGGIIYINLEINAIYNS